MHRDSKTLSGSYIFCFAETDLALDQHFSARIGVRAENSSYISKWNFSPRLAIAYRISKEWTSSLAYGIFYQNPESKYINYPAPLGFQRADHYIFQIQRSANERNFRLEAFYKDYRRLTKPIIMGICKIRLLSTTSSQQLM